MTILFWISELVDFGTIMPRTLSSTSILMLHRTRQPQPLLATVDMKGPNETSTKKECWM